MAERQIEGYPNNGGSGSGTQVPPEMMKLFEILAPKESPIERVVVAFNVAAAHCAIKAQNPKPLNK